ncbi:MAG: copper oxidase, partial [Deltaproteobacteria bacterium]
MIRPNTLRNLAALAVAGALAACGGSSTSSGDTPATYNDLLVPPLLTGTTSGGVTTFDLALASSTKQLMPGARTETYG